VATTTAPDEPLAAFAHSLQTAGLARRTIEGYLDDARLFCRFLGDTDLWAALRRASTETITDFLHYCALERGNGQRSLARKLSALKALFRALERMGAVSGNPTAGVPSVAFERMLPRPLALAEARGLLQTVRRVSNHPERDYALFCTFLHCGCRLSEAAGLRLGDVDLPGCWLTVRGRRGRTRLVPLTTTAARAYAEWLACRPPVDHDHLFVGRAGRPMSARSMQYVCGRIATHLSLPHPGLSLHRLRHTCLALLHQSGMDIRSLQEVAGHADLSSTQVYARISEENLQEKMSRHPLNEARSRSVQEGIKGGMKKHHKIDCS
jgi:site-specific recombinase XerD